MKVAIIGYGFVGKALSNGLSKKVQIIKIDPKIGKSIKDLEVFKPDIIFICLPTPMSDLGDQNINLVKKYVEDLKKINPNFLIVIKSTITPSNVQLIQNINSNIVYNPEFLRENHADEDFINSNLIVFGGKNEKIKKVSAFYKTYTKCKSKDYIFTDEITASLIKYAINSFLALKVVYFNQFKNLYDKSGAEQDWNAFVNILSNDKRIGDSHMQVPGHDGRFGFGGACFPKDVSAILNYSNSIGINFEILSKAMAINNDIRSNYKDQTKRETDQNITFDKS